MSCASLSFSMVQKIHKEPKPSLSTLLAWSTVNVLFFFNFHDFCYGNFIAVYRPWWQLCGEL